MKKRTLLFLVLTSMLLIGVNGYSMHIMEGFLPLNWVIVWFAVCIPFWIIGIKKLQSVSKGRVREKMTLALAGAFIFVLSALKIPSVTGSSSHPTGVGLSTILFRTFCNFHSWNNRINISSRIACTRRIYNFGSKRCFNGNCRTNCIIFSV